MIRAFRLFFLPLAFGCLCYFVWGARHTLISVFGSARVTYLAAAIAGWCMVHLMAAAFAVAALNGCGARIGYAAALRIHVLNLPARYLPGGIWHTVGRVADFAGQGVGRRQLTAFVLLENALAAAVTLMFGGASVWHFHATQEWGEIALLGALGGALALSLIPILFRRSALAELSPAAYVKMVSAMLIFWLVAATTFVLFSYSFPNVIDSTSFPEVGGAYLFSWGVGYIAFFAPQGLGIFEAVAGSVLRSALSFGELVSVVVGFRMVVLFADVITWGIGVIVWGMRQKG